MELLVVIAVMALLMGILLPSLNVAGTLGKRLVSSSNMRQIGIALTLFAEDHKGEFPLTAHDTPLEKTWIYTLLPYFENINEIRVCPADPKRSIQLEQGGTSYILNEYIAVRNLDPFGQPAGPSYTNLNKLRKPHLTITTFIAADRYGVGETDHTHSRLWFAAAPNVPWDSIRNDIQVDRFTTGKKAPDNTRGTTLLLYADAHVESVKAETLRESALNRVNFAEPPK